MPDHAGSAQTAAIDLNQPRTSVAVETWGAPIGAAAVAARPLACPIALRATFPLAVAVYLLALGGSAITGISAPILDGVPPCLVPAAALWWYSRQAFPGAVRTLLFAEDTIIVITLGVVLHASAVSVPSWISRCETAK
jgi:hypothetical protein